MDLFTPAHLAFLKRNGYVIIPNVVDAKLCQDSLQELLHIFTIWDNLLTPDTPTHWKGVNMPFGTIHGIHRICAQTQAQWNIRQDPRVAQVFADYWSLVSDTPVTTFDLVTSMDAFGFYLANSPTRQARQDKLWTHTDHGNHCPNALDNNCLQGFVNLIDCTDHDDGGLVVYKKGHRAWQGYWDANPTVQTTANWYRYPDQYLEEIQVNGSRYLAESDPRYGKRIRMRHTCVKAAQGDLVLWYSQTPHQNQAPQQGAHDRAVVYVCMAPKSYLSKRDKQRRQKAFKENRQTAHWPAGNQVTLFPRSVGRCFGPTAREDYRQKKERLQQFMQDPFISKPPLLTELGESLLGI